MRRFVASRDMCQRVKHLNRSSDIKGRNHVPSKPGELCSINLCGPLPTGRGGDRYILVCFEVVSKYVKLYSLKTATTRSCLHKLVKHYFVEEGKPKVKLSDKGTLFQSQLWTGTMQNMMLRFDIPLLNTRKQSNWKMHEINFKDLRDLLLFQPSKVGRINSSHRISAKQHRCKRHLIYTSWIIFVADGNNWVMDKLFVLDCLPGCAFKPADHRPPTASAVYSKCGCSSERLGDISKEISD